jgi:anionic cell wall polymer biosynthesis LytR-Cps2A-Psr (LCP) family protein
MRAINRNLDLNCEEVVVVNWKAVADAVDKMGGVEIEILESEISEMNKYILDTQRNIGGSKALITKPGLQTLNGNQAVTYGRIRKDHAQGDYRRNERMKILVAACFEKAKTMSFSELNALTSEILPQVKTNMTNSQMMDLLLDISAYSITDSVGWPYKTAGWTHNGVWYGPPITLNSNVIQLHEELFNQPGYVPTDTVQSISNQISTLTGRW